MDVKFILEERLRELASVGDASQLSVLLSQGVDINARNQMNGWTALHWAAKRNHGTIVELLLKSGADPTVCNSMGKTAADLASSEAVAALFGEGGGARAGTKKETVEMFDFVPNYLKHPPFPYLDDSKDEEALPVPMAPPRPAFVADAPTRPIPPVAQPEVGVTHMSRAESASQERASVVAVDSPLIQTRASPSNSPYSLNPLGVAPGAVVLKLRIADCGDGDFIEAELPRCSGFAGLVRLFSGELSVDPARISKVRKLPNTVVRDDRDIARLLHFQELEVVVL